MDELFEDSQFDDEVVNSFGIFGLGKTDLDIAHVRKIGQAGLLCY